MGRNPLIIAFLGGAAVAALIGVIVVAAGRGSENGGSKNLLAQAATATATQAATATQLPSPIPAPTQPPAPPPPPPPEPTPRTCAEIRADPNYRTDAERDFFIRNCGTTAAAAPTARPGAPPPPLPPPPAAGLTAEEQSYISRASVVMGQYIARLAQYWHTPSFGAYSDLYELASIALNHANALNALQPVPDRYRASHDRLVQSLLALRDHILTVRSLGSRQQFTVWLATYDRLTDGLDQALKAYSTNTGIPIQNLGGLR